MNLGAALIPPSLDAKQALRLRRFGLAAFSYVLAMAMALVAWAFGVLPGAVVLQTGAAFVASNLLLYWAIRSGFNLRFEDPSLTRFQILWAIAVLMNVVYHMDSGRDIALSACFIIFQFGIFRLTVREFAVVTLYTLAAYALVINLLMHFRPLAIHDVPGEWLSWLGLAGFLPCMNFVGGQINALRRRMRESEARFRSLTEMSTDFYWASDAEHRITERSSANTRIGAVSIFRQGAQVGQRRWEVPSLSPDEAGWEGHRAVLDGHQPFREFEFSRLALDGIERHISISGDPVFDAAGKFTGYRGVGRDVTERKQADAALRESEERFRSLTEMSSDFYWESDAQHRLSERSSADMRKHNIPEFQQGPRVGERRWEIPYLSPDEAGWREHRAILDAHQPFRDFELSRLEADDTERYTSISGYPVFDAADEFRGYRGVGTDITARERSKQALLESEERFRLTFALAGSGMAHVGMDGRFQRVNHSLCAMLGYSAEDLLGRTVADFSHPEDRGITDAARARMRSGEMESARFHKRYLRKDGATVWVDLSVALVRNADGKPQYEIAVFDDNTVRKKAEQALHDSEQQLRLFADNVPVMTAYWDEDFRCRFANRAFTAAYGLAMEDVIGKHARDIFGEELFLDNERYALEVKQGHPVSYQRKRMMKNGEVRYFEMRLVPDFGEHDRVVGCFAVTIDITEHKLVEERVQRVAHHDDLTGLPNRLLFNDRLTQAINLAKRDSRQFALLYLDLNKFKPVNDTLGHAAGDELLKAVAARIRRQVRESDTVARVGGDEFTVILTDVARREDAKFVAGKISAALAAPFELGPRKQSVEIGASIGVAIYPADARDADALVKAADDAMYGAKQAEIRQ